MKSSVKISDNDLLRFCFNNERLKFRLIIFNIDDVIFDVISISIPYIQWTS